MDLEPIDNIRASAMDAIMGQGTRMAQDQQAAQADVAAAPPMAEIDNWAPLIDPTAASTLVNQVDDEVEQCERGRRDLIQLQRDGIMRLGVDRTIKARSDPFEGASVVVHPALMQACLDFAALAASEFCPATGPAREHSSDTGNEASARCGRFLNRLLTQRCTEWRPETDRLLMRLPVEGSSFSKVWMDRDLKRPRIAYIPVDQIVMPYTDTGEPETAPLLAHKLWLHASAVKANIASGLWSEHDARATQTFIDQDQSIRDVSDQVVGVHGNETSSDVTGQYRYNEVAVWGTFDQLPAAERTPQEWLVTYEVETRKLVALRKNSRPGSNRRRASFLHYRMFPWVGAYGIGFFHIIGGLSDASTGALRALLDGAQIKNMPGGIYLGDDSTAQGENLRIAPMTWKRMKRAGVRDVRQIAMPLPYDGPSVVLFQLLEFLTTQSREFASVSMQRITEMKGEQPVGTTLALIEGGARIYSAVHARLMHPTQQSLEATRDLAREMPIEERLSLCEEPEDQQLFASPDAPGLADVVRPVPVATSEAPSATHRIAKAQARLQLGQQAQQLGIAVEMRTLFIKAGKAMGLNDVEMDFPEPQPLNADAYTETAQGIGGKVTLQLGPQDNHLEHFQVHLGVLKLPGLAQGPTGQGLIKHCIEHAAAAAMMQGQQQPQAGVSMWTEMMQALTAAIAVPDPAAKIAETEMAKVQQRGESDSAKMELAIFKQQAEQEALAAELAAKVRLAREENQLDMEKLRVETQLKLEEIAVKARLEISGRREASAASIAGQREQRVHDAGMAREGAAHARVQQFEGAMIKGDQAREGAMIKGEQARESAAASAEQAREMAKLKPKPAPAKKGK